MSQIWTFSPTSQPLLKRCLDAAAPCDSTNKWVKHFGLKNKEFIDDNSKIIDLNDPSDAQNELATDDKEVTCDIDEIFESDTVLARFDVFQEESMKNPIILTKLAEKLSITTIEGIFRVIFDGTEKNSVFISHFFEYFFPVFIRRDNSRLCTDVLLKCYNTYAEHFKNVLKTVIKDVQVQNNVLNDFILTLNEAEVTDFFNNLMYIELSPEEFVHHLFSIYTAYKTCKKSENILNYVFNCLKMYNKFCLNDKNYGRLLLTYLQSVNSLGSKIDGAVIEEILENHSSPFKRPCITILKEINDK